MSLDVRLIAHTPSPAVVVAAAAKLCCSPSPVDGILASLSGAGVGEFLDALRESGHASPFEHASFTFSVEGASRVATHQLVRHRLASYSQRSQRYVPPGETDCVVPPKVASNPEAARIFGEAAASARAAYEKLTGLGVPDEDARFILPHGWETSIIVTMNAREMGHFFALRLCRRAQWEIRAIAREMLRLALAAAPEIFYASGPPCVSGACRELKSCGRPYGGVDEILGAP